MQPCVSRRAFLAAACAAAAVGRSAAWAGKSRELRPLLIDAAGPSIRPATQWERHRESLVRWWTEFLGPMPVPTMAPAITIVEEDRPEGAIRQLVRYEAEPGIQVEAYLIRPSSVAGRVPGIVVLHPTVKQTIREPAGLEGPADRAFGLNLARLGCVTVSPMNFLWVGEGDPNARVERFKQRHPHARGMAKMLYDSRLALELLAAMPEVDPRRIGAIGHSLGAKEVLYLAAFDERIKAAVSCEGGIGTTFSNWDAPWYLGPQIQEPSFTHEHHELLALTAPRAMLLVGGDSADGEQSRPFIDAARPVYELYGKADQLELLNHRQGHAVPAEAARFMERWLIGHLSQTPM